MRPLVPPLPAVTSTVQASMLTGEPPSVHGAVANGWFYRETAEIRFWQQSRSLLQAPTLFDRWRTSRPGEQSAQLFWWWNLPSAADISVTPRPTYWADGRKGPDIHAWPDGLRDRLVGQLGSFPLFRFWGPGADIGSTQWIVEATLNILKTERPSLATVYLPHLDYDLQRYGPTSPQALHALAELDAECGRLLDAAAAEGIEVLLLSEYGIEAVDRPVLLNRALREAGLLAVHRAQNGELLDPGRSRAFAVCDHQIAHVYVADPADQPRVRALLEKLEGVGALLDSDGKRAACLDHPRSGEFVAVAASGSWFAYPYWLEDKHAPDFARTVEIHRKPGYDPCELLIDPALALPKLRIAAKLLRKRLGFRTLLDLIPLDPSLIRGSHGRLPDHPDDGPVWIGTQELAAAPGPVSAEAALAPLRASPHSR